MCIYAECADMRIAKKWHMANPSIHAFWQALAFLHCFKLFLFNSPTVLNKSLWEKENRCILQYPFR